MIWIILKVRLRAEQLLFTFQCLWTLLCLFLIKTRLFHLTLFKSKVFILNRQSDFFSDHCCAIKWLNMEIFEDNGHLPSVFVSYLFSHMTWMQHHCKKNNNNSVFLTSLFFLDPESQSLRQRRGSYQIFPRLAATTLGLHLHQMRYSDFSASLLHCPPAPRLKGRGEGVKKKKKENCLQVWTNTTASNGFVCPREPPRKK